MSEIAASVPSAMVAHLRAHCEPDTRYHGYTLYRRPFGVIVVWADCGLYFDDFPSALFFAQANADDEGGRWVVDGGNAVSFRD